MTSVRYKIFYRTFPTLGPESGPWTHYDTRAFAPVDDHYAWRMLDNLRMSNMNFEWKMEKIEPTYRYRIMARPRYNSTVDWFPIYRNRTYMTQDEARRTMKQLTRMDCDLVFNIQEEEVAD